jgi:hypothetical protein
MKAKLISSVQTACGERQPSPLGRRQAITKRPSVPVKMICAFFALFVTTSAGATVPAFPGAEGAGAFATGGRAGTVCEVKNLNDSGPGSLRACVDMKGPRTVVFKVSGTIKLDGALQVTNPYITIAGQTAPGGGIQLVGKTPGTIPHGTASPSDANLGGLLRITTHDVIVRYLRLRHGYTGPEGVGRT